MTKKSSVALGNFDGLHMGHMKVLESALSSSRDGVVPCVLLFDCHPQKVIKGVEPSYIMTPHDRNEMLEGMGFTLVTVSFEEIRNLSPEEFVRNILVGRLNAVTVCCGYNYRFGKDGEGNSSRLFEICEKHGVKTVVCDEQTVDGETVSSTRIRKLLAEGDVEGAEKLLGRPFSYTFEVVEGNKNGRLLGFPTANQAFPEGFAVPKYGVYASKTAVDGRRYRSITNIGIRPTINDDTLLSETHIIGFDGDLYGRKIKVELSRFIRPERKFKSLEEVFSQVREDIKYAQE